MRTAGRRHRMAAALGVAALAITLAACASSPQTIAKVPPPSGATTAPPLQVSVTRTLNLTGAQYTQPALDWPNLALVTNVKAGGKNRRALMVTNLRRRNTAFVAVSQWPHGLLSNPVLTGNWVAWTDQSHVQSTGSASTGGGSHSMVVQWAVHAQNLRTHTTLTLAQSPSAGDAFPPKVAAAGGRVVWAQAEHRTGPSMTVYLEDLQSRSRTAVMHHVSVGEVGISGSTLIYTRATQHPQRSNVWSRPLAGGVATQLSSSKGGADDINVASGHVVWQQPAQGSPTTLVVSPVGDRQPLAIAGPSQGWARVGAGFVAYLDTHGYLAAPTVANGHPVPLPKVRGVLNLALAVDGHHVVWGGPLSGAAQGSRFDVGTVS